MKTPSSTTLWFDRPGQGWFEGLPVGNGRTGAMITGGLPIQTLHLNDETFWSPAPRERDFTGARNAMDRVRELIAVGDVLGAQAVAAPVLGSPTEIGAFQPIGDLTLSSDVDIADADFVRMLDLATGVATFTWSWPDGRTLVREVVASRSPSVFLVSQRATIDTAPTRVSLDSPFGVRVAQATDETLVVAGQWHEVTPNRTLIADSYRLRDYSEGVHLRFAVGVRQLVGKGTVVNGSLQLDPGDWTIAIALGTDFAGLDPEESVGSVLDALDHSIDVLVDSAVAEHAEVFNRAAIALTIADPLTHLTTDRRVHSVRAGGIDDHLVLLLADYGRYLQIASTLGGTLPPTLQGVWNADTEPAWCSNYTLNINLQMCLWSADAYHFTEALDILRNYVDQLSEAGRRTASELYGAQGWVVHHNSDIWMNTAPATLVEVGLFAAAGPWMVQQLWQHYRSFPELGGEQELFRLVEGITEFFETWLVVDSDGYLATSPSSTPENAYLLDGVTRPRSRAVDPEFWRHGWIGQAPTLDMLLVRDTLHTALSLGEKVGATTEQRERWRYLLSRLRPVPLQDGEVPEWTWPYRALELGHRHLSPLYGLYPGNDDFDSPSELRDAAWMTLANRQANVTSSSNSWSGWSKVWAAACWARLGEGDRALASLDSLVKSGIAPDSLLHAFTDFDGTPGPDAVHVSDANMGLTAAVTEFLVGSRQGVIHLLPALPSRWLEGSVRGIRAHGGVDVDFSWSNSRVATATLVASRDQTVTVSAPGLRQGQRRSQVVSLSAGIPVSVTFEDGE